MLPAAPFLLFDDAREGGAPGRLYAPPIHSLEAWRPDEIAPLLQDVRAALAAGRHAAGFLSYEAAVAFEPSVPDRDRQTPLAWFGLFDGYATVDPPSLLPDLAGAWVGPPCPRVDYAAYAAMFEEVQALIAAGDIYQANLTFRADVPFAGDTHALYTRLRASARSGWGALVETGRDTLLSFSPELFFKLEADALTCRPMKGTARRLTDPIADLGAAHALGTDAKQRAENLMIVDLMRNDLSRVAASGSVAVPELFAVESYPSVHQLTSTVTAELAPGKDALDVLAALFPCGSITGAPKVRAMQAIAGIEPDPRGPYSGAIGWLDPNGDAQFNVAIRTLLIRGEESRAVMGLGGGIVADSTAASEWDEAHAKGAFVTHDPPRFDLIETMAFDPDEGIALLDRHFARMRDSAETLGFAFDRHDARNELQAATFHLRRPAKVRLLLAPTGALAVEVAALPPARDRMSARLAPLPVGAADVRLRHKTSDRRCYAADGAGVDEVIFLDPAGFVTEGSYTSVFVNRDGHLLTPPLARGLLPGVLRAELIATGRVREADLIAADLSDGFLLGNALRGLVPAVLAP